MEKENYKSRINDEDFEGHIFSLFEEYDPREFQELFNHLIINHNENDDYVAQNYKMISYLNTFFKNMEVEMIIAEDEEEDSENAKDVLYLAEVAKVWRILSGTNSDATPRESIAELAKELKTIPPMIKKVASTLPDGAKEKTPLLLYAKNLEVIKANLDITVGTTL